MNNQQHQVNQFTELSGALTDFNTFALHGTGQVQNYFQTLNDIVGKDIVEQLLNVFEVVYKSACDEQMFNTSIRKQILGDVKLGPIARNIIKLWYTGTWYQLPHVWRESFGKSEHDVTFFVSSAAYTEGLLWQAIDANPSGAKGPGYGSWSDAPRINFDNSWQFVRQH
ncbi:MULTISPECIES: D-sorbitol dehydrogenase [Pseudoalteromonas]|uniref:Membrane bound FAD containing D-sorbitol dehydrogenase n=1 Tax=Pseudoalteromonas luteoviolacea (strain 2ta16) TaxID=1353533 RepID=V4HMM4_PSEL2|nr:MULTISPECIES: D-sorbitol dehydrogenase [Pseudoalteromonas]ESP92070.1 membrane bound FAD containing D-sorbitol dehydrogenase [Pseudoalteromonas luteoviolacea 2ta16]KZN29174.1 hypothetical protein N483_07010 [Pseudoalteromonas luteoviolacea NCIMB 1944]MCG7546839.1 hypothetical protein [Pseudoalteromonas sp. Of7M-16]